MQANLLAGNNPSGAHTSIGAVMPAQFQNLAITCSNDPSMRVLTVSGGQTAAVFTQALWEDFAHDCGYQLTEPYVDDAIHGIEKYLIKIGLMQPRQKESL